MKHYIEIAKQYFEYMEGLHLYRPIRSYRLVLWLTALLLWLGSIVVFFIQRDQWPFWPMLGGIAVTEIAWLAASQHVGAWRRQRLVELTNLRLDTSFSDASECRERLLQDFVARPPSEYLTAAKEIRDLTELRSKFRKRSDLDFSEIGRSIYDRDSKARLLALVIALCSMVVALSVRSDATLETLFDAYTNPGWQKFIVFLAALALAGFMLFVGFKVLLLSLLDALALWGAKVKVLRHMFFVDWVVGYLVRDLVVYHNPRECSTPELAAKLEHIGAKTVNNSTGSPEANHGDQRVTFDVGATLWVPESLPRLLFTVSSLQPPYHFCCEGGDYCPRAIRKFHKSWQVLLNIS